MEKLRKSALIKDIINEKTKKLLDEGKLQEAKKLINLGEKIPKKLSQEVILAEQYHKEYHFKKAKKCYIKAAELAEQIQETELVEILKKKAEKVGDLTDILKTFEVINKAIRKSLEDLELPHVDIYENIIPLIEKNVKLSNSLENNSLRDILVKLQNLTQNASKKSKELEKLDDEIKNLAKKL
ncbi:MAG: hypothetical protein ACFFAN_03645 [Promethearchaeota archaeon]